MLTGAAVRIICQRLDGIALAIELAAARMVSLSPEAVLERLDNRFGLLSGGRRARNGIKPSVTRWNGLTSFWTTASGWYWLAARCSRAGSTCRGRPALRVGGELAA
jgi:hypothetical protein